MRYEIIKVKWDDGYHYHFLQIADDGGDSGHEEYINNTMIIDEDNDIINSFKYCHLILDHDKYEKYVKERFAY